jgi:cell division protease FtsH
MNPPPSGETSPMSPPPPAGTLTTMSIAQPIPPKPDDRTPKTRPKLLFFDRIKVLLIIAVVLGLYIAKRHADIPIMSWGDAVDEQLRAKQWMLWVAGFEVLRQFHYLISERSMRYHQWWHRNVWGRWDAFCGRRSAWTRFRVARATKRLFFVVVLAFLGSWAWDVTPVQAIVEAPSRIFDFLWSPAAGLPFIFQLIFILGLAVMQFVAIFWFMARGGYETYMPSEVKTRFADVWGQDHVVDRVKENIIFLEKPEEIEAKGGHVPSGILLWGPPGTGKTLLAEAVAGETGRPYMFVEPGAFQAMFIGVGVMKVKALFRKLRKLALRFGGVIVFFDEADVLGNRGGAVSNQARRRPDDLLHAHHHGCNGMGYLSEQSQMRLFNSELSPITAEQPRVGGIKGIVMGGMGGGGMGELQALLTELSGLAKPRGFFNRRVRAFLNMPAKAPPKYRMLVMMATNMPSSLDPALLRPGRIDRSYKVGYPSKDGRKRTYEGYFGRIKHSITPQQLEKLSTMTPYATGASIKDLVNESLIIALRKGRDFVTWPDVIEARTMKMMGPPDNSEYIERDRHHVAVHEACHALMTYRVMKGHDIDIATIERRGDIGGFVAPIPLEDRFGEWRSTFESDILVSLASLAGERLFFEGDNSSGVSGDLRQATRLSLEMEAYFGMGGTITSQAADWKPGSDLKVSDGMLRGPMGERVEQRLQMLFEKATQIIAENRFEVLAIAHALETYKTITGEDIAAIIEGYPGPLVDGRPYHQPQFTEVAEAYHQRVLAAHKEQSKVDMQLPVWVDDRQSALAGAGSSNASNSSGPADWPYTRTETPRPDDQRG